MTKHGKSKKSTKKKGKKNKASENLSIEVVHGNQTLACPNCQAVLHVEARFFPVITEESLKDQPSLIDQIRRAQAQADILDAVRALVPESQLAQEWAEHAISDDSLGDAELQAWGKALVLGEDEKADFEAWWRERHTTGIATHRDELGHLRTSDGARVYEPPVMATPQDEQEITARYGKTTTELADEAEAGYETSTFGQATQ